MVKQRRGLGALPKNRTVIVGFIKKILFPPLFPQETDELYIVSQFFVEEWRKFVR